MVRGEKEETVLVVVVTIGVWVVVGSQRISSLEPTINDDAADEEESEQRSEFRQKIVAETTAAEI